MCYYLLLRYGNAETITKYWSCLICAKELKCQKGIIIQHLLNVHTLVSWFLFITISL